MASNTEKPAQTQDLSTPKETFEALAKEYEFHTDFAAKLVELKFATLLDFKHAFASETEIVANLCSVCGDEGKKLVQQSRVRRAWWGVSAALAAKAGRASLGDDLDDLDAPLSSTELEHMDHSFANRYKTYYPPSRSPADVVTSRSAREMTKRKLTLRDLASVKTVAQLQHCQRKRRRLAENIYHEQVDTESSTSIETCAGYLANLLTYLLSLARAGIKPIDPPPSTPESYSTDSTLYVHCPLDIVMRYYWRAYLIQEILPPAQALSVIRRQDIQERTEWVDRFRSSSLPLGQIIKQVFEQRSAHWDVSNMVDLKPARGTGASPKAGADGQAGESATELRDGTRLCPAWNSKAGCSNPQCGASHRCSYTKSSGRICGSWGHNFTQHKEPGS